PTRSMRCPHLCSRPRRSVDLKRAYSNPNGPVRQPRRCILDRRPAPRPERRRETDKTPQRTRWSRNLQQFPRDSRWTSSPGSRKQGPFSQLGWQTPERHSHHYYASRFWTALSLQSQRTYRHILDHFVEEHGHRLVRQMEARHVEAIIAAKASTPAAANKLRKPLGLLMRVAILNGYRKDNPVAAVKGIKIKSKGHRTWTDDEIIASRKSTRLAPKHVSPSASCYGRGRGAGT